MQDAAVPQTDRELLLSLDQKVENFIDKSEDRQERTVKALEQLVVRFEKFEETKFSTLDNRVTKLEGWKNKWSGAYMLVIVLVGLITIVVGIKEFLGK